MTSSWCLPAQSKGRTHSFWDSGGCRRDGTPPRRARRGGAEPIKGWEVTQYVRACVRARSRRRRRRRSGEARAGDRAGIGPRAGAVREAPIGSWGRGRSPGGRDWNRARERGGRSQGPGLGGGTALRRRGGAGTPAAVPPPSRTSCGTSARASPPER